MKLLRPQGRRDLYGLCSPTKESETHFDYGIGVIMDEDTDTAKLEELLGNGCSVWEVVLFTARSGIREAEVPETKNMFLHLAFPGSRQTAIHCKTEGLQQHFTKKGQGYAKSVQP